MTIILYDIPSTYPGNAWSPNPWKARFCLNYKGLPYRTEWVEYPDIAPLSKKLGIAPTSKRPDGTLHYTLPAIHDPATGVYIADSLAIAEYLEKTYPDKPSLFPHNTAAFQSLYEGNLSASVLRSIMPFILPDAAPKLNKASQDHYRKFRSEDIGAPLEEVYPKGEAAVALWAKFKDGLGTVDGWYSKNDGPFLMGDVPSWADFVTASYINFTRTVWRDEEKWKDIASWHGGRWEKLLESVKQYMTVV